MIDVSRRDVEKLSSSSARSVHGRGEACESGRAQAILGDILNSAGPGLTLSARNHPTTTTFILAFTAISSTPEQSLDITEDIV